MKIHDMTQKTTLEVQDTDLLIIEDEEDTKAITVSAFKEVMSSYSDGRAKKFINATIDKIIVALQNVKYGLTKLRQYVVYTRIDSSVGDVYIALKDLSTNKWLTSEEIMAATLLAGENGFASFKVRMLVAEMYEEATAYTMQRFADLYAENIQTELDQELLDADAGVVMAHFAGLTQNEIAGVTYDDIAVTLPIEEFEFELDAEDPLQFKFTTDKDLFVNNVPYSGVV